MHLATFKGHVYKLLKNFMKFSQSHYFIINFIMRKLRRNERWRGIKHSYICIYNYELSTKQPTTAPRQRAQQNVASEKFVVCFGIY